jgi:UDP-glucose 4-epimerase
MRVLVTGGAGFIGSNLANVLVDRKNDVAVLDDLSLGIPQNLSDEVELIHGSVTNREAVEEAVDGCDRVFHLAAKSSVTMIQDDPVMGEEINVAGFLRVLEAAKRSSVARVVYASTSSMYSAIEPPHREDATIVPGTLYEQNFLAREHIGSIYSASSGIETVGMRFFSVYGPNEWHKGKYANLVSQFIWDMVKGERPVIFGDGSQTRDFTHVSDVCEALMLASEAPGVAGQVFNVCTGRSQSLNELVEIINQVLGTDLEAEYVPNPLKAYVAHTLGDPGKAKRMLGFQAKVDLKRGVSELCELEKGR